MATHLISYKSPRSNEMKDLYQELSTERTSNYYKKEDALDAYKNRIFIYLLYI